MRERQAVWFPVLVAFLVFAAPAWPQEAPAPEREIAAVTFTPQGIEWRPLVEHARLVLTVSEPGKGVLRREFQAGEVPSLDLFDARGERLADGSYTWELRLIPQLDEKIRALLEALRASGSPIAGTKLLPGGARPPRLAQAGYFSVRGGSIVIPDLEGQGEGPRQATAPAITNVAPPDTTVPDDLITQGNACVGIDCANGESFGDTVQRLKANVVRLELSDTSATAGFPTRDWKITANDAASGGADRLSIDDVDGGKTPFTLEAGAPSHSLYVDDLGRVGFGTATPAMDLHVASGGTPALRLEQDGSGGLTPQSWDVAGNESGFFVRDATNGAAVPFRIKAGAPASSLVVAGTGTNVKVGVGTGTPTGLLHLFGAALDDVFAGMGVDLDIGPAFNYGYSGNSFGRSSGFFNIRPDASAAAPNPSLRFMTGNVQRLIVDNDGFLGLGGSGFNPEHPIHHAASGARLTSGGAWTNGSSRDLKQDIRELPAGEARAALEGLVPVTFRYKAEPGDESVGFIAEDVPDLVATPDRKSLSPMDVVAVLWRSRRAVTTWTSRKICSVKPQCSHAVHPAR